MKKTLIYLNQAELAPKGGPYAVGYYIKKRLEELGNTDISFIPVNQRNVASNVSIKANSIISKGKYLYHIWNRYRRYSNALKTGGYARIDLNQFEIVHFHHTRELFEARKSLENYKGKIILTSHSPVPLSKEIFDEQITNIEKRIFRKTYSRLIEMDEYAFNRADYILFPCEEAEEPYINNWPSYTQIRKNRKDRYVYIPTGIPDCSPKWGRSVIRNELGISDGDFVISYVGRHNYIKGYDSLKKIGAKVLSTHNAWVVVAGKEAPLTRLQNERWIEIGWTNDAHSYISASDVFVLPNLETYFDIVMLEVLALGKIVVASRTGGNKYFEKLPDSEGIFLYDNLDEACALLDRIKTYSREKREMLGMKNRSLFLKYFTDKVYVDHYIKFLNTL